jgi:hypothetical protein
MKFSIEFEYDEEKNPYNIGWAIRDEAGEYWTSGCDSVESFLESVIHDIFENAGVGEDVICEWCHGDHLEEDCPYIEEDMEDITDRSSWHQESPLPPFNNQRLKNLLNRVGPVEK